MKNNFLLESEDYLLIDLKIKEKIGELGFLNVEVNRYDLEEDSLGRVLEDLDTYGLFSSKKIIVVNNVELLNNDEKDKDVKHFFDYLKNPVSDNLVFLTAKKLNNTKKVVKELKKLVTVLTLSMDINSYIKKELEGYQLESGVIKEISSRTLDDIGRIHEECEKLKMVNYPTKRISVNDVNQLVIKKLGDPRDLTFDFVRSLASKNKEKALKQYIELQDYAIDALSLIGLLASQFLIMYQVKLLEKETNLNQKIADILGEKPYRIQKTRELTSAFTLKELGEVLRYLSDMDLKIKTSDVDGNFLVELFILKFT